MRGEALVFRRGRRPTASHLAAHAAARPDLRHGQAERLRPLLRLGERDLTACDAALVRPRRLAVGAPLSDLADVLALVPPRDFGAAVGVEPHPNAVPLPLLVPLADVPITISVRLLNLRVLRRGGRGGGSERGTQQMGGGLTE